jgi:hypothetical protein
MAPAPGSTGWAAKPGSISTLLGLALLVLFQQSTLAATQADDAAALLQFAAVSGLTGVGWTGSQPCLPGTLFSLSVIAIQVQMLRLWM